MRTRGLGRRRGGRRLRRPLPVALALALAAAPAAARANGDGTAAAPPTVFERFVLSACAPCVREMYPVAALATAPLAVPAFPRVAAATAGRHGEIGIEVLRAHQPGRPDWRSLALRITLSVRTAPGGEMFRLGVGLLDGAEVAPLARAVGDMVRSAAAPPPDAAAESVDVDFHGGSLRVGVLRVRGAALAYVQTGELPILLQRAPWEVPTTLYLPLDQLPAVAAALGRAAATVEDLGGR